MKIYLDNAATTPMDPEVVDAMIPVMKNQFGNPSSIHSWGREVKTAIENARKNVAKCLNVAPAEIFFTSGGTEANNTAIFCSVRDLGVKHAITSRIEHHAVLHTLEELEKEGYDHFMLKEIYQQPTTIRESMRGRISAQDGWVLVGGMQQYINRITSAKRIIFAACGTSWHSALVAEYLIEELARIPVEVEYASELRYRNPIINADDVVIAISQSGETADTLAALELAKEKGALIYGIVNVVGSSIARITHCGSYTHAGPEIGVASTKAFTSQLTVLTLMALNLGHRRGTISEDYFRQLAYALESIPEKVEKVLLQNDKIKFIAGEIKDVSNALYLGRGFNFPVALEGALKLKEISYIHAEGYPAAEMKHGPIALIDENMPVIIIATNKSAYDKVASNIMEVKARKAIVISIVTEGDTKIREMSDYCIEIPETEEPLTPLLSVIPLQLLAYHIAVLRGCDVDQPRNLAKSVTVE